MIREVKREEIPDCVSLIKKAFLTVADEFGFTEENAPRFTAFATNEERLLWQMDGEHRLMVELQKSGCHKCLCYQLPTSPELWSVEF